MVNAKETVGQVLSRGKASGTVRRLLNDCALDGGTGEPAVSVLSLLRSAGREEFLQSADSRGLAARLFSARLRNDSILERFSESTVANAGSPLSPGLQLAFADTEKLRERVGGKDPLFGLRHLLFSMLSCREAPLGPEMDETLDLLGLRRGPSMRAAADFVLRHLEQQESEAQWLRIFDERAVPGAGGVPISQRDDPWAEHVVDRSGAQREAEAFAKMILAKTFEPPLAVGVFGDWGSGKSFFLRLVHDEVEKLKRSENDTAGHPADEGGVDFLSRVAQIRFNAWHYAETNLWASLVTHIFTDLDRSANEGLPGAAAVVGRLSAAREVTVNAAEQLIARRRDVNAAKKREEESQDALILAQAAPPRSRAALLHAAWSTAARDGRIDRLRRDIEVLGVDAASAPAEDLRRVVQELDEEILGHSVWRAIFHTVTRPPILIGLVLGTLAVAILFNRLSASGDAITEALATIGGFISSLAAGLGLVAARARKALNGVRGFRARFDRAMEDQTEQEQEALAAASANRVRAEAAVAAASEALQAARDEVDAVAREYGCQMGEARVYDFVRGRIASGVYAGQLGFVATVRQDFEELSRLMQPRTAKEKEAAAAELAAHRERIAGLLAAPELNAEEKAWLQASADAADQGKGLDRIILYIDDLDRCPTKKVVEVLQAIHLLLAFPLFVVFVAVDVRWLRHALEEEYSGQIHQTGGATATAGDYLEKIFQIPYWVRPLGGSPTEKLLRDHLEGDVEAEPGEQTEAERGDAGESEEQVIADTTAAAGAGNGGHSLATAASRLPRLPRLRIQPEEADFIVRMGAYLDGSPRRTLRFINSYRLIKASLGDAALAKLGGGDYRELLTLLTVSIAADAFYPSLVYQLRQQSPTPDWFDKAVASSQAPAIEIALARNAMAELGAKPRPLALKSYALLIERFSFHPSLREAPAPPDAGQPAAAPAKPAKAPAKPAMPRRKIIRPTDRPAGTIPGAARE